MIPLLAATLAVTQVPTDPEKGYLMFFTKGEVAGPTDPAVSAEMMKGHLGNMTRLYKEGKLTAAGPLKDPSGKIRGLTVVWAKHYSEVDKMFEEDPFVKAGMMKVTHQMWSVKRSQFGKPHETEIAEHRMVIFYRQDNEKPITSINRAYAYESHPAALTAMLKDIGPNIYAPMNTKTTHWETLIIASKDDHLIRKKVSALPLVQAGRYTFEIFPLWMGKGTVPGS